MTKPRTLRYRAPTDDGTPAPGAILMGNGPRVRRAYRVLGTRKAGGTPALGFSTWRIAVEALSAAHGREEIAAGAPHWSITWNRH